MPQLKPSFVRKVRSALAHSAFTPEDFEFGLPSSGRVLLKITFVHKPEYTFTVFEEEKQESIVVEQKHLASSRTEHYKRWVYTVVTTPGAYKLTASEDLDDLGDVIEKIPDWCENIREDLYALAPTKDPLEQLRAQMKNKLEELVGDSDGYFSDEELSVIDQRFDKLYEDIAGLKEQYNLTKQQLAELQKNVEEFKQSARAFPKGLWAKVTGNKLLKTTAQMVNTPEGRALIFKGIGKALGLSDGS